MKKYERTYELYEGETGVLLVDNLTFEEAAEQAAVYMEFFETKNIVLAYRDWVHNTAIHTTNSQYFKDAFIDYFGELQEMGNLN